MTKEPEAPRWRANQRSYIGHSLIEEGAECVYTPSKDGEVAANLSPLNPEAQAIVDAQKSDHPDKTQPKDHPAPHKAKEPADEDDGPYADHTVAAMRKLAKDRDIDLGDATTRKDIVAVLVKADAKIDKATRAADAASGGGDGEGGDNIA